MSLEKLLELSKRELTEEERKERNATYQKRFEEMEARLHKEFVARYKCTICGADTWNYSHTFDCPRRGSGF